MESNRHFHKTDQWTSHSNTMRIFTSGTINPFSFLNNHSIATTPHPTCHFQRIPAPSSGNWIDYLSGPIQLLPCEFWEQWGILWILLIPSKWWKLIQFWCNCCIDVTSCSCFHWQSLNKSWKHLVSPMHWMNKNQKSFSLIAPLFMGQNANWSREKVVSQYVEDLVVLWLGD